MPSSSLLRVVSIFCVQHVARMSGRLILNFGCRAYGPINLIQLIVVNAKGHSD
jgi:hypothetical protein